MDQAPLSKVHPHLDFRLGNIEDERFLSSLPGPFDFILIADNFGSLDDCQKVLENLHLLCTRDTRLVHRFREAAQIRSLRKDSII
jgi:hypothetical protein